MRNTWRRDRRQFHAALRGLRCVTELFAGEDWEREDLEVRADLALDLLETLRLGIRLLLRGRFN